MVTKCEQDIQLATIHLVSKIRFARVDTRKQLASVDRAFRSTLARLLPKLYVIATQGLIIKSQEQPLLPEEMAQPVAKRLPGRLRKITKALNH